MDVVDDGNGRARGDLVKEEKGDHRGNENHQDDAANNDITTRWTQYVEDN